MAEEELVEEGKGKKGKKKANYCEVEFEIGNIEFEAKGRSIVVERMFRMLLEKIEEGKLVAEFKLQEVEEEEEEESSTEPEVPEPPAEEPSLDPPPEWDTLETEEPEVSDAEREELGIK